jgi:hypothetical protein
MFYISECLEVSGIYFNGSRENLLPVTKISRYRWFSLYILDWLYQADAVARAVPNISKEVVILIFSSSS